MIIAITMIFCSLILVGFFYASNRTGAKPNGNMLLGVTLPYDALKDENVAEIIKRYKKAYSLVCLGFLLLTAPFIFVAEYTSVTLIYFFVYTAVVSCFNQITVDKYVKEMYALKRRKQWWTGAKNIVSIDTEVSRLKNTFPVSKQWFIIPLIISVAPIIIGLLGKNKDMEMVIWILAATGISTLLIIFLVYLAFGKDRTVTYSENTEVNLALNRVYKREWTRCWLILACINSTMMTGMSFLLLNVADNSLGSALLLVISFISVIFFAAPPFYAHNKVRDMRNKLLRLINEEVYTDDDEYWVFGAAFYNNPNDSRAIVEKRIGYGMTTNLASWLGKVTYVVIAGAAALMIGLGIWSMPMDFGSVSLTVSEQTVAIDAPLYSYTFSAEDIKSVKIIDDFPNAVRTNGGANQKFYTGRFRVSGYGASNVYIYCNSPPYIVIELEDIWVFVNGKTPEETKSFYNKLYKLNELNE